MAAMYQIELLQWAIDHVLLQYITCCCCNRQCITCGCTVSYSTAAIGNVSRAAAVVGKESHVAAIGNVLHGAAMHHRLLQ